MLNDDHTGSVLEFVDSDAEIPEATTFVLTAGTNKYWKTHELSQITKNNKSLFFIHFNLRSNQKNFDNFYHVVSSLRKLPDAIFISKTGLKQEPIVNIDLPGYNFVDIKTQTNAGGVCIYLQNFVLHAKPARIFG